MADFSSILSKIRDVQSTSPLFRGTVQPPAYKAPTPPVIPTMPAAPTESPLSQLISQVGQYLQPAKPFTEVMPYETFVAPGREALTLWEQQTFRPEFEYQTLDPFLRQYGNIAGTTALSRMGSAPERYEYARRMVEQPYFNQLERARQSYEDMLRSQYESRLGRYYESPTAFSTIGL